MRVRGVTRRKGRWRRGAPPARRRSRRRSRPPGAASSYVATQRERPDSGTRARPWRTIQKALDTTRGPGQRASVGRGTYARTSSSAAPALVQGADHGRRRIPGARVVLRARSTSGDTYPLRIRGSYFRLRGFVIENARGHVFDERLLRGQRARRRARGNEIRYSQDQGIFAEASTRNLHILRNRIHDNGRGHEEGQHQSHGIYIEGADHLIANNVVWAHPFGFGIQIYPENSGTDRGHNTIVGAAHSGIVVGGRRRRRRTS